MDQSQREYFAQAYNPSEMRRVEQGWQDSIQDLRRRSADVEKIKLRLDDIDAMLAEAAPRTALVLLAERDRWRAELHRARSNLMSIERRAWDLESLLDRGRAVASILKDGG
jgi:cob(I)alamin adenosyltransferase